MRDRWRANFYPVGIAHSVVVSLLVFATGQPPPGRELVPAGRPRDGRYIRGGGSATALRTDQNGTCFRQAQV